MNRLRQLPDLFVLVAALWLVGTLATVWGGRLFHPFDLEWMEGGMLAHAWRIANGLPVYVAPSPDFVPFVYPPGYATLLAGLSALTGGVDYVPGRAISLLGTLAAAAAVGSGVWQHGGRQWATAVGAAAAFLGCYTHSGAFYDLVRPDALSVGLLGWAVVAALGRRPVAAGLLLAAAFWAKHSAALYGVPLVLGLWSRDGLAPALRFAVAAVAPALTATVVVQAWSGGHFLRYLLLVPGSHPTVGWRVWPLTPSELGFALPVLLPVIAVAAALVPTRRVPVHVAVLVPAVAAAADLGLALAFRATAPTALIGHFALTLALGAAIVHGVDRALDRSRPDPGWVFAVGLGVAALGSAMLMRGHQGGFVNVHMPAHWLACLGAGVVLGQWRRADPRVGVAVVASAVLALQLLVHRGEVASGGLVPTEADRVAGEAIVKDLEVMPGPILSPYAVWMPVQAGHPPSLHAIGLMDITHDDGPYAADVARIDAAIAGKAWGTVLDGTRSVGHGVDRAYRKEREVLPDGDLLRPRSGWDVRPKVLKRPR